MFTSAGLIGEARARRRREEDGRDGLMECACTLFQTVSCKVRNNKIRHWRTTYLKTSLGSPNLLKTNDLACV